VTWYSTPARQNGHLARMDADGVCRTTTYCGLPLSSLTEFQPAHDGQCCFQCVPAAERRGQHVDMPGYPDEPFLNVDRPEVEPVDLDTVLRARAVGDVAH